MKKKPERGTLEQAVDRELQALHNGRASKEGTSLSKGEPTKPPSARRWRVWLFLAACLAGSAVISFVIFKYVAPSIPRELVGTWKVSEGPMKDATLEFRWYGTAIATTTVKGTKEETRQAVKVVGNKILLTTRDERTGNEDTVSQTILKLSGDELIIRDEDRKVYTMKRIHD